MLPSSHLAIVLKQAGNGNGNGNGNEWRSYVPYTHYRLANIGQRRLEKNETVGTVVETVT
jgi:hypothetical protein